MYLNHYKIMIEKEKPSSELIQNTKAKMKMSITKKSLNKKYLPILVASILLVVFSTTSFAYGDDIINEIKRLIFGASTITQADETDNGMISLKIINRSNATKTGYERRDNEMYSQQSREVKGFSSYKDANKAAPFHIKEPSWIPEKVALNSVNIIVAKNKKLSHDVIINYGSTEADANGQYAWIILKQYYSGPDASIEIKTVMSVDRIKINDIEGSVATIGDNFICLYWIKDDIVFELQGSCYDLETLIAIAKSI